MEGGSHERQYSVSTSHNWSRLTAFPIAAMHVLGTSPRKLRHSAMYSGKDFPKPFTRQSVIGSLGFIGKGNVHERISIVSPIEQSRTHFGRSIAHIEARIYLNHLLFFTNLSQPHSSNVHTRTYWCGHRSRGRWGTSEAHIDDLTTRPRDLKFNWSSIRRGFGLGCQESVYSFRPREHAK